MDALLYAWATGHGVALASLSNVANSLKPYTKNRLVPPVSQPVPKYPIRRRALSGVERGEGDITHVWEFRPMTLEGLDYLIDTFLVTGGVAVASKAITIYTRLHDRGAFARYNAYICLPQPRNPFVAEYDYEVVREHIPILQVRFNQLEAL